MAQMQGGHGRLAFRYEQQFVSAATAAPFSVATAPEYLSCALGACFGAILQLGK